MKYDRLMHKLAAVSEHCSAGIHAPNQDRRHVRLFDHGRTEEHMIEVEEVEPKGRLNLGSRRLQAIHMPGVWSIEQSP
jgi:hypothetical protein